MEDESNGSGANGLSQRSPESPCSKSSSNNNNNSDNNNKEQDRFLPIANVGRIMKKVIPGNGKISKDAKETVQECVSEFISFVTGEASDKCQREKRKTINGDDILWAITTLGFEDYVSPLKHYLRKYREIEGEKLNAPRQHRQIQQEDEPSVPYISCSNSNVYSCTDLISQPHFAATDHPFPLHFSPSTLQNQTQQQEQIDPVAQW